MSPLTYMQFFLYLVFYYRFMASSRTRAH